MQPAPRVQRHRHRARGLVEQIAPGLAQERAERRRQRAASVVLERVDDLAERAFVVRTDAPRQGAGGRRRQVGTWRVAGRWRATTAASGRMLCRRRPQPMDAASRARTPGRRADARAHARTPRRRARARPRAARWVRDRPRMASYGRASSRELVPLGVAPEPLEAVEGAALAAEDVDDEVEVVEQDPFGALHAFGQRRPLVELVLQRLAHRVGDRGDLPRRWRRCRSRSSR